jgi:hypothetical protein
LIGNLKLPAFMNVTVDEGRSQVRLAPAVARPQAMPASVAKSNKTKAPIRSILHEGFLSRA